MRMNRISFPSQLRWNTVDTKVVATTCNGVDAEQSFLLVVAILVVDIKQQHKELEFFLGTSRYIP